MTTQTYNATTSATAPSNYERMVCGATRQLNGAMLDLLERHLPFDGSSTLLDNACGPGIATTELIATRPGKAARMKVIDADLSQGMLDEAKKEVNTRLGGQHTLDITYIAQDVRNLDKVPSGSISHVNTSLGILIPGDEESGSLKAASEVYRVLQPGGVAAFSLWADRGFPLAFANAARAARPDFSYTESRWAISEHRLKGSWLLSRMEEAGFGRNVMIKPVQVDMKTKDSETLLNSLLLAKHTIWKDLNDEEMGTAESEFRKELQKLAMYGENPDGSAKLTMTAWIGICWKSMDGDECRPSV